VQDAAGALEKAIRDRAPDADRRAAARRTATALGPLVAGVRAWMGAPTPTAAPPGTPGTADPGAARAAAERLLELLAAFDAGSPDFVAEHRDALRTLFPGPRWADLEKFVQEYAFAEARAAVASALGKVAP
jgi:hypothetical protein